MKEAGAQAAAWLEERDPGRHWTGYDLGGWAATVWILHSIFEAAALPSSISHDDIVKGRAPSGALPPEVVAWAHEAVQGSGRGSLREEFPTLGWNRLRWTELTGRLGVEPPSGARLPSDAFPWRSWPINIDGPREGGLDCEQLECLVAHLATVTPGELHGTCFVLQAGLWTGDFDHPTVSQCELRELQPLYAAGSGVLPTNLWPADKSWFVYSDYDLCGTKVSGPAEFIDRLVADPELETLILSV